jgi:hypothetical protein
MPIHVLLLQSLWPHSSPVANDGLWVKLEQAKAKQWWALQQPHICESRTWIMITIDQLHHKKNKLALIHMLLQSLWLYNHQWQMMASGSNRNKQQQNSGDIAATAYLWIQDMDYDEYRPATPLDTLLLPIHVLFWSLWLNSSPGANDGLLVK